MIVETFRKNIRKKQISYTYSNVMMNLLNRKTYPQPYLEKIQNDTKSQFAILSTVSEEIYSTNKYTISFSHPLVKRAYETKNIIISNDIQNDPRLKDHNSRFSRMCIIPIMYDDELYGHIIFCNFPKRYSTRKLKRLQKEFNILSSICILFSKDKNYKNFIFLMTHSMKTSLHSILGMTNLLTNILPKNNNLAKEYTSRIMSSCEELVTSISNSVDYQKIQMNCIDINHTLFDIYEFMNNVNDLLLSKFESFEKRLIIDIDPNTPKIIFSDMERLKQIIINIILFRIDSNISIIIYKNNTNIYFEIHDDKHMFRTDGLFSTNFEYGNIEMPVTKTLVNLLGGEIDVKSMGEGTTFTFYIPFAQSTNKNTRRIVCISLDHPQRKFLRSCFLEWGYNFSIYSSYDEYENERCDIMMIDFQNEKESMNIIERVRNNNKVHIVGFNISNFQDELSHFDSCLENLDVKTEIYRSLSQSNHKITKHTSSMNIAIVEDDENSAYALSEILNTLGIENVQKFDNGETFVDQMKENMYDIVFMDCRINGKCDGIQTTQKIFSVDKNVCVYGISAELSQEQRQTWTNYGVTQILTKPFRFEDIQKLL